MYDKAVNEGAVQHCSTSLCTGDNFKQVMDALNEYAESRADTGTEQDAVAKELKKVEKQIANSVDAIAGGFDADELKERYQSLKGQKTALQGELADLEQKAPDQIKFDEESVLWALRNMREAITNPRTEENLKRLYEKLIDSVEVFEGYVTVALKILPSWVSAGRSGFLHMKRSPHLTTVKQGPGMSVEYGKDITQ